MKKLLLVVLLMFAAGCGGEAVLPPPTTVAAPPTTSAAELAAKYESCRDDAKAILIRAKPQINALLDGGIEEAAARSQRFSVDLRSSFENLRTRCRQLVPECPTIVDDFVAFWTQWADHFVSVALGDTSVKEPAGQSPDPVTPC